MILLVIHSPPLTCKLLGVHCEQWLNVVKVILNVIWTVWRIKKKFANSFLLE